MQLNFKHFGSGFPLVILHGLMGSLDNWQTLAKEYAPYFSVYIIDQRNHGRSPHSDDFSYQHLVEDLQQFLAAQQIEKCHLMGHSMGGKTAMAFALQYPDLVEKLIVVDIAPSIYEDRHDTIFTALNKIDLTTLNSRQEAEKILNNNINEQATVQLLLKNLYRDTYNHFQWRFNLPILEKAYIAISDSIQSNIAFTHSTLFIKGEKSDYINAANYSEIIDLFPNNELVEIPAAGHWVHAENPKEFVKATLEFLKKE